MRIDSNFGQVADSIENHIHAMPCPRHLACPISRQTESKRQAEFYRDTGIWAPAGARATLEDLMHNHGFTAPKLKAAWQANSLQWDDARAELVAKTYWFEPLSGYCVAIIMVMYLLIECAAIVINPPKGAWTSLVQFISVVALYSIVLYLAARFLVAPYSIARKVERITHPTKSQNRFAWRFWAVRR